MKTTANFLLSLALSFSFFNVSAQCSHNIEIEVIQEPFCPGTFILGQLNANVTNGSGNFTYIWLDSNGNNPTGGPQTASTSSPYLDVNEEYTVFVTDTDNNCVESQSHTFNEYVCVSDTASITVNSQFDANPVDYGVYSQTELQINNHGCEVNLKPQFTVSHDLPIQQGDITIEFSNANSNWEVIPYTIDQNGDAVGYWGDLDGEEVACAGSQSRPVRIKFSQYEPQANLGQYTASLKLWSVDGDGTLLNQISDDMASISIVLQDTLCQNIELNITVTDASCPNENEGLIDLSPSDGEAPYLFSINNSSFSATTLYPNLATGSYEVLMSDANNCQRVETVVINPSSVLPDSLWFTETDNFSTIINWNEESQVDGYKFRYKLLADSWSVVIGSGVYNDNIAELNTSKQVSGLSPDSDYEVQVKVNSLIDCEEGWSSSYYFSTTDVSYNFTIDSTCVDFSEGQITLNFQSQELGYQFDWSGPNNFTSTDTSISQLEAGEYNLIITNSLLELVLDTLINISEYNLDEIPLTINGNSSSIIIFEEQPYANICNPDMYLNAPDGYTNYTWNDSIMGQDILPDTSSLFYLTAIDQNGCFASSDTLNITYVSDNVLFQQNNTNEEYISDIYNYCSGTEPIELDISELVSGDFSIKWSKIEGLTSIPFSTSSAVSITPDESAVYLLEIYNCSFNFYVNYSESPTLSYDLTNNNLCPGDNNAIVSFEITAPVPSLYFFKKDDVTLYSGETLSLIDSIENLSGGLYSFFISDQINCEVEEFIEISEPDTTLLNSVVVENALCYQGEGSLVFELSGASPFDVFLNGELASTNIQDSTPILINELLANSYELEINDVNGCVTYFDFEITQPDSLLLDSILVNHFLCYQDSLALINVAAIGGISDYNYDLYFEGDFVENQNNGIFDSLVAGNYSVVVQDANDCIATYEVLIAENDELLVSENLDDHLDVLCGEINNGAFSLLAEGGASPYTVNILGEESFDYPHLFDGLNSDSIVVELYDSLGCSKEVLIVLLEIESVFVEEKEIITPFCHNGLGSFEFAINVDSSPFTFTLNDSLVNPIFDEDSLTYLLSDLEVLAYTLEVVNFNGCFASYSFEISDTLTTVVTSLVSQEDLNCYGDSSASFILNTIGGTEPYFYDLYDESNSLLASQFDANFQDLPEGNYSVFTQDQNGCIDSIDVDIQSNLEIQITENLLDHNDVSCFNGSDGSFSLNVTGGVPNYTINILDFGNFNYPEIIDDLEVGEYTAIVSDALFCTKEIQIIITGPDSSYFEALNWNDTICYGSNDASIDYLIAGDLLESYHILNGDTMAPLNSLSAGTYFLEVADLNNCTIDTTFEIYETEEFFITVSEELSNDVTCYNGEDGLIVIEISGGTPMYTYSLNNSFAQSSNLFSDLSADTFLISVSDSYECVRELEYELTEPSNTFLIQDFIVSDNADYCTLCHDDSTGSVLVNVNGGFSPGNNEYYINEIANVDINSSIFENLVGGQNYSIYALDTEGCSSDTVIVECNAPDSLELAVASVDAPSCCNTCDGEVILVALGGVLPYQYSMDSLLFQISNVFSDTCGTNLSFLVQDSNGCRSSVSQIDLSLPECIELDTINVTDPSSFAVISYDECQNLNSGEIHVQANGGSGTYEYALQNQDFNSNSVWNNLSSGDYSIYVRDEMNCVDSISATILLGDPITVAQFYIDTIYCGLPGVISSTNSVDLGGFSFDVVGGTPSYSFSLDQDSANFQSTPNFTNLSAGIYSVNIVDDFDCLLEYDVEILSSNFDFDYVISDISCFGFDDGAVEILSYMDSSNPTFELDGNIVMNSLYSGLNSGDHILSSYYSISDIDNELCLKSDSFNISEPEDLKFNYEVNNISCYEACDGSILITDISGGSAPYYSYCVTLLDSSMFVEDLCDGSYAFNVSDDNGCVNFQEISILEPSPMYPIINLIDGNLAVIEPTSDNPSSGVPPYTYQWYNDNELVVGEIAEYFGSDLVVGSYYVFISDDNGCQSYSSVFNYNFSDLDIALFEAMDVFPNPVVDRLFVKTNIEEGVNWNLSDSQGRLINTGIGSDLLTIDFKNYENGGYFLSVYQMQSNNIYKIVKHSK